MVNNKVHNQNLGNIWFGFATGIVLGGGGLYLLGTKDGRVLLKKIIAFIEDMEFSAEDVLNGVEEVLNAEVSDETDVQQGAKPHNDSLNMVLDKIKHVFPIEGQVKRYFAREGRIQKSS